MNEPTVFYSCSDCGRKYQDKDELTSIAVSVWSYSEHLRYHWVQQEAKICKHCLRQYINAT